MTDIALLIALLIPILYGLLVAIVWCTLTTGSLVREQAVAIAPFSTKWVVRLAYRRWHSYKR